MLLALFLLLPLVIFGGSFIEYSKDLSDKLSYDDNSIIGKGIFASGKVAWRKPDAPAALIIEERASEKKWDDAFLNSQGMLEEMAQQALAEHKLQIDWRQEIRYRVLIGQDEDGAFVAEVPALSGCISEGNTRAEAVENIKEAIGVYLESLEAHGEPIPPAITEELVEVAA